jgi:hypothetical protein
MSQPDLSAITDVVPQISYDIIARIIPGTVLIFSLITAASGPAQALATIDAWVIHPDTPPSGWGVILFVISGYVLALLLTGICDFPNRLPRLHKKKKEKEEEKLLFRRKYDIIRHKLPGAGARIVKQSAEMRLGGLLAVGWSICAVINAYFLISDFSLDRLWLEVALIAGIVAAFSFRDHIAELQKTRVDNHWLILFLDPWLTSISLSLATSKSPETQPSEET